MRRAILIVSALYLAAIALGLIAFPKEFGVGAVPRDASPELIALLRLLGGPFLGIAALNWLARDEGPSPALRTILIANVVGFAAVALNDIHGVVSGDAREIAKIFLIVHLAFALAFAAALRGLKKPAATPDVD